MYHIGASASSRARFVSSAELSATLRALGAPNSFSIQLDRTIVSSVNQSRDHAATPPSVNPELPNWTATNNASSVHTFGPAAAPPDTRSSSSRTTRVAKRGTKSPIPQTRTLMPNRPGRWRSRRNVCLQVLMTVRPPCPFAATARIWTSGPTPSPPARPIQRCAPRPG